MKVLYNTESQAVSAYPRADDEPVVGLDLVYLVLTQVETPAPSLAAISSWEVDLDSLEYRQVWIEPTPPLPDPDWTAFNTEMFLDKDWSSYINPPMLMAAATSAALSRDVAQLHYCLELAYQTVGEPSEAARTRWNNLAQRFNIGVTF